MIGRVFLGRYEAQKALGEGGMGKVYLARQLDLGRTVVVKVMHDHIAADPKFRDRFQRETLLMARFQHPNAVTLYDASLTDPNGPCIVMEYVKGVNLESLLAKNGKLSPARVGRLLGQLCDVLQAAHDDGMIHRDLKPANLMISEPDTPKERVKVMDFGLAKKIEDPSDRRVTDTTVDFAVGTPGYICPEQVRGEAMDHRGDLYSVGVMLFELIAGRLPFLGASSMDVLLSHATEDPPAFADVVPNLHVPAGVEEIIRACMAKDPADRPQSARELATRYAAALSQPGHGAMQPMAVGVAQGGTDSDPIMLSSARSSGLSLPTMPDMRLPPLPEPAPPRPGPLKSRAAAPTADSGALPFHLDAWMPESIALVKLRGFVNDCGGEVLETSHSMIRVRLGKPAGGASGAFSWLGLTRRTDGPIDVELYMRRADTTRDNKISIRILFRPAHPSFLSSDEWRKRCSSLFVQLRAYLMGAA